jgi:hypothetical protein
VWLLCLDGPTLIHRHTVLSWPELAGLDALSSLLTSRKPGIDPERMPTPSAWGSRRTSVQLCDYFLWTICEDRHPLMNLIESGLRPVSFSIAIFTIV